MNRVRDGLRAVVGWFPLTLGGVLVVALSTFAFVAYGVRQADLLLAVLGGLGLALVIAAAVAVTVGAVRVWAFVRSHGSRPAIEAECGRPSRTGFEVPALWWLPVVAVEWRWIDPAVEVTYERKKGRLHERVVGTARTEREQVVREFEVADAFGLAKIRFRRKEIRDVRFVPHTGRLDQMHVVQGLAGGDATAHPEGAPTGDHFDMRTYAPGDPIRFVLWKVFARSRDLVVRTPERAVSPIQRTVAYLVAASGDEPAAGAARMVAQRGALGGDWTLGADGVAEQARTLPDALEVIVKSSLATPAESGAGLQRFLDDAAPGGARRAVVFVPPRPGPWVDRVAEAARGRTGGPLQLDFVVCVDGLTPPPRRGIVSKILLNPDADPGAADRTGLRSVLSSLGRVGANVIVVDRLAGQVLPAAHLRGLGAT